MAARIRKIRHDDETRAKIQTSQLVNRLTAHVLGQVDMKPSQVSAALGLLRKTLPDLAMIESLSEVTHRYVARVPEKSPSADEWQHQHAPDQTTH